MSPEGIYLFFAIAISDLDFRATLFSAPLLSACRSWAEYADTLTHTHMPPHVKFIESLSWNQVIKIKILWQSHQLKPVLVLLSVAVLRGLICISPQRYSTCVRLMRALPAPPCQTQTHTHQWSQPNHCLSSQHRTSHRLREFKLKKVYLKVICGESYCAIVNF